MEHLLLLHGAIGSSRQLEPFAEQLNGNFQLHLLDFSGHGGLPFNGETFSIKLFADDVLRYMGEKSLKHVSIFGYSMGGYVGMYLARHYPEKIKKVVTLATKYHWDEATAAREALMLNPEKIEQKIPAFADSLRQMHAPNDWKEVLRRTGMMMADMGKDAPLKPDDYVHVAQPVTLLLGDKDKMVSQQETMEVKALLPNAQMALLPETPHPMDQVSTDMLSHIARAYL